MGTVIRIHESYPSFAFQVSYSLCSSAAAVLTLLMTRFYNDDFFTPLPSLEHDALPMADLVTSTTPDILSVAFDPEGTGPDTHYKVLQLVAASLRICLERGDPVKDMLIWGYRNVWFTFAPSAATLMFPVSLKDLDLMHDTFMNCFTTQAAASFPSPYFDGPFSAWAKLIQQKQREKLGILLGEAFFKDHEDERVRSANGFVFIKGMTLEQFLSEVEELKSRFQSA
jgi:glucosamine-6-phosphate deaminase